MTRAYPTKEFGDTIFIIDEPRESCDACPVAEAGKCNGRLSTKAELSADRDLKFNEWEKYLKEIKAKCSPEIWY